MVIGPVGSGKSTLLKALAGDITPVKGSLTLNLLDVAYCQQTPWLANSTVRDIIVGQSNLDDKVWYQTVLKCCALDEDIASFSNGDQWVVGSGGIALSGGQKQRLALARAIYSRKPLLILDDVLSALDPKTEQIVFEALLSEQGILRQYGTTVVMATHGLKHLPAADQIVVLGEDGTVSHVSTFEHLQEHPDFRQSLDIKAHQIQQLEVSLVSKNRPSPKTKGKAPSLSTSKSSRKTGELSDYADYFRSIGWSRALVFILIVVLFIFCSKFSQVWLQWFTGGKIVDRGVFIGGYFGFTLATTILYLLTFWWMMIVIAPVSSADLHWQLVTGVFRAPLSFFSTTDAGVILNRFSQDMAFTNAQLPICTNQTVQMFLACIVQIALISTASGYLAAVIPAILVIVYGLQKLYLRTSRQLRLLDLEYKSPVYTFFTETIDGLATIRAFGWTMPFMKRFLNRLNDSQRPVYTLYLIQRWLNFVLDIMVAVIAVLLIAFATQFRSTSSGPALGVAMLNLLSFNQSLSQLVFFYTEWETCLGAISRIKEFAGLSPEDSNGQIHEPPSHWPSNGHVRLENVSAAYNSTGDLALKNISLEIPHGQMVGIAGRTGSGKSSIFLALLGFLEIRSGNIYIDGIDVSTVPRDTLRSRITTIPQDPYFPGKQSIRFCLTGIATEIQDKDIIKTLATVGLLPHLMSSVVGASSLPSTNTSINKPNDTEIVHLLDTEMNALPLSPGQLQLFCLARALLHNSKVVLLDEVTSGVDLATEEKLRAVLRDGFRGKTVIFIAHRPEMLKGCDVVVSLEAGRLIVAESKLG